MNLLLFSLQEQTATQIRTPGSSSSSISMSASLWSGNLRLSLVLIPVKLHSAVSTEEAISFRMIHEPSGQPIRYVKGIETEKGFEEVPEEEIVKGYEHAKGHHVLLRPQELDELRLEAKHTIDMVRSSTKPTSTVAIGRSPVT
jgi:non-homologous end joining protein Ku